MSKHNLLLPLNLEKKKLPFKLGKKTKKEEEKEMHVSPTVYQSSKIKIKNLVKDLVKSTQKEWKAFYYI